MTPSGLPGAVGVVRPPRSPRTRLVVVSTAAVGQAAAVIIAAAVAARPTGVLGVATGSSPMSLYAALAGMRADGLATEGLSLVALDEYAGLAGDDPRSYRSYVGTHIAEPLGVPAARTFVPAGSTAAQGAEYERTIRRLGGVDLQIVGIGRNGHIGFNEPGSAFDSRTRPVELDPSTRIANAPYFGGDPAAVPARAMTQGIGTILDARAVVLVVQGRAKAEALAAALYGPITPDVPASVLQAHRNVTVVADTDAFEAR